MMDVINQRGQLIFGRIKNSLLASNGHANIWNIIQINLLILVIQLSSINCLLQNVEMQCDSSSMTAIIKTSEPFRGRLFSLSHPYECYNIGRGESSNTIALSLPLHGRQCGTQNLGNGTFTNTLVLQHHPLILRNTDRRIDVACDYHQVQRKLRGGKQVMEGEMLTMTQVVTGLAPTPPVRLKVLNSSGEEVRGVDLGDPLYLKVEMLDESVFGIFGSELVARSGEGSESVVLIDDHGCPIEPNVFPALDRENKSSKSLVAPFQAFRFASDSSVKFQMTVSFCLDSCQPVSCEDGHEDNQKERPLILSDPSGKLKESFGKRRRRRKRDVLAKRVVGSSESDDPYTMPPLDDLHSGDIITDVTMETSVFVVNNLKPLGSLNEHNKFKEDQDNDKTSDSLPHHLDEDVLTSKFGIRMNDYGVCFSPILIYGAIIIGTLSQLSIFGLCFWMMVSGRKHRSTSNSYSSSSSSTSSYKDSSRASISSKTSLYDSRN